MSYRTEVFRIPPTPLGESFRRIINHPVLLENRQALIGSLKNTATTMLFGINLLDNIYTDNNKVVRYQSDLGMREMRVKGPMLVGCEGITIPLRSKNTEIYSEIELCVVGGCRALFTTEPKVGIRMLVATTRTWSNVLWFRSPVGVLEQLGFYCDPNKEYK